jgi:hypothetical protein
MYHHGDLEYQVPHHCAVSKLYCTMMAIKLLMMYAMNKGVGLSLHVTAVVWNNLKFAITVQCVWL